MYSNCVFVFVFYCVCSVLCIEDLLYEDVPEGPLSTYICDTCTCSDGLVDCENKGLKESFTEEEWTGLRNSNVTEVRLSNNFILELTQIPTLPIKILNVSNCKIDSIEDRCFSYLADLEAMDLSQNKIINLDKKAFWGLLIANTKPRTFAKMKWLSLAHNELHTLPNDAFGHMQGLTFLDISDNPLGIIDQVVMATLSDLSLLEELRISGCELQTLPEGLLRRNRRLKVLDISGNKFSVIPSVLSEAVNLISLNFDKNPITSIKEETSLSRLVNLQHLTISRCTKLITIGPYAMGGLESLISLSISNNPRLSTIDDDFLTWIDDHDTERRPLLKELYLNNNNITEIDSDFLFRWDQLQKMDFSDNPFECNCSSQWMVDVLVPFINDNNGSASDMICKTPQEMRGLSFAQLYSTSKTLPCPSTDEALQQTASANTAIILGVMIGTFATFPLILLIVLLWKRGYFAKCRRKMSNERDSDDEEGAL